MEFNLENAYIHHDPKPTGLSDEQRDRPMYMVGCYEECTPVGIPEAIDFKIADAIIEGGYYER